MKLTSPPSHGRGHTLRTSEGSCISQQSAGSPAVAAAGAAASAVAGTTGDCRSAKHGCSGGANLLRLSPSFLDSALLPGAPSGVCSLRCSNLALAVLDAVGIWGVVDGPPGVEASCGAGRAGDAAEARVCSLRRRLQGDPGRVVADIISVSALS